MCFGLVGGMGVGRIDVGEWCGVWSRLVIVLGLIFLRMI